MQKQMCKELQPWQPKFSNEALLPFLIHIQDRSLTFLFPGDSTIEFDIAGMRKYFDKVEIRYNRVQFNGLLQYLEDPFSLDNKVQSIEVEVTLKENDVTGLSKLTL